MVAATDLKSVEGNFVRVRVPPSAHIGVWLRWLKRRVWDAEIPSSSLGTPTTRASYTGITSAFQADERGSTPLARSLLSPNSSVG
jgi:hypothetical protein